jgi:hypothetical protein
VDVLLYQHYELLCCAVVDNVSCDLFAMPSLQTADKSQLSKSWNGLLLLLLL